MATKYTVPKQIRFTENQFKELENYSTETGLSVTAIVRVATKYYLDTNK